MNPNSPYAKKNLAWTQRSNEVKFTKAVTHQVPTQNYGHMKNVRYGLQKSAGVPTQAGFINGINPSVPVLAK